MPKNFLNAPNADFNVMSDDDSINLSILNVLTSLAQKCRPTWISFNFVKHPERFTAMLFFGCYSNFLIKELSH